MTDHTYQEALRRRDQLRSELDRLEIFISMHEEIAGQLAPHDTEEPAPKSPASAAIIEVLTKARHPMKRAQIADELAKAGVDVRFNYLGTLLWRMRDRIENVPRKGYRLKS